MSQSEYQQSQLLMQNGRFGEAKRLLAKLAVQYPNDFNTVRYCGLAHQYDGDFDRALDYYQHCSVIQPENADPFIDIGTCHASLGDFLNARRAFRQAIKKNPKIAMAYSNLGFIEYKLGNMEPAESCLRQALKLDSRLALAYKNLGHVFQDTGRWQEALGSYEKALKFDPDIAEVLSALFYTCRTLCSWDKLEKYEKLLLTQSTQLLSEGYPSHIVPFIAVFLDLTQQSLYEIVASQARANIANADKLKPGEHFSYPSKKTEKLRIGYLTSTFHSHATTHLAHTLFGLHDDNEFEIVAYAGIEPDYSLAEIQKIRAEVSRLEDLSALSDLQAAEKINRDGIHILIDMDGYINNNRHTIVSLKPAPIQVNFLGYPGTLGSPRVDYIIGDAVVTPPEYSSYIEENPVLMPNCYQFNNYRVLPVAPTPSRTELHLPEDSFVYCCFNISRKIEPVVFNSWMNILNKVPGSVLWFLSDTREGEKNLKKEAKKRNIDPARLIFADRASNEHHLARQKAADLFLDTFFCNAHTTASDALWSELPVITLQGRTFANRVASSIVNAVGLHECIADSIENYEAIAINYGQNREQLAKLKEKLAGLRPSSPLFDSEQYVRHLERAYQQMWENHLNGCHSAIDVRKIN